MKRIAPILGLLLVACDPGSLLGISDADSPSGVPEHSADPAGEPTAPMELPEGSSSEEDIRAALTGGVPAGRWKEGLLFEGLRPQPWLKSAANWFPRNSYSELLQEWPDDGGGTPQEGSEPRTPAPAS